MDGKAQATRTDFWIFSGLILVAFLGIYMIERKKLKVLEQITKKAPEPVKKEEKKK